MKKSRYIITKDFVYRILWILITGIYLKIFGLNVTDGTVIINVSIYKFLSIGFFLIPFIGYRTRKAKVVESLRICLLAFITAVFLILQPHTGDVMLAGVLLFILFFFAKGMGVISSTDEGTVMGVLISIYLLSIASYGYNLQMPEREAFHTYFSTSVFALALLIVYYVMEIIDQDGHGIDEDTEYIDELLEEMTNEE